MFRLNDDLLVSPLQMVVVCFFLSHLPRCSASEFTKTIVFW